MRRDRCARSRHRVGMRYRATGCDLCIRGTRLSHIILASVEAVAKHELQHGPRQAPGRVSELLETALLGRCESNRFHSQQVKSYAPIGSQEMWRGRKRRCVRADNGVIPSQADQYAVVTGS
jgi:hypothetical protein